MAGTDKNTMAEGMGDALEETPAGHDHAKQGEHDVAKGLDKVGAGIGGAANDAAGARRDVARGMDEAGKR